MKNLFLSILIVGLVAVLLFGCTGGNNYGNPPTSPGTNTPPATNPPQAQTPNSTTTPPPTPAPGIDVKMSTGGYLVDSKGMTLYFFTKDVDGTSACTGACLEKWPVFYAENIKVSGLGSADFGTITRSDGSRQTTYLGWPLYYYFQDKAPGDITGEGVGKVWYLAKEYTVTIADKLNMTYLVDGKGRTLYRYTHDSPGVRTCTGECLFTWPALYSVSISVPSALNANDFGKVIDEETDTYKGMTLYYYADDTKRGETNGQGSGGIWYVVSP